MKIVQNEGKSVGHSQHLVIILLIFVSLEWIQIRKTKWPNFIIIIMLILSLRSVEKVDFIYFNF